MGNKIYYLLLKDINEEIHALKNNDALFIAEIDGNLIHTLQDFLQITSEIFQFPVPSKGLDSYLDWITDLDWLMKEGYVLIIYNFSNFMGKDLSTKETIIHDFEEVVLPWWGKDVERCVVGGKAKQFDIYLLD